MDQQLKLETLPLQLPFPLHHNLLPHLPAPRIFSRFVKAVTTNIVLCLLDRFFQLAQQQQQQQHVPAMGGGLGGAGIGAGGGGGLDLSALRDNPQIAQLREMVAQNPAMIQPLIQQLATANPQMAQLIAQNPEALFQLLGGGEDFDEEGPLPPGTQVVNITVEERAAIERVSAYLDQTLSSADEAVAQLEALGFSRDAVIEAYFACDKNEELAANYLFEGGFEDH